MHSYADALEQLLAAGRAARLPVERVPLAAALGRRAAENVAARISMPRFDNAAMDGFAIRMADAAAGSQPRLVGEQFAGQLDDWTLAPGECLRITTGAPIPDDAEAVVQKEWTVLQGDRVRIEREVRVGQNIRRIGEDFLAGDNLVAAGTRLDAARLSLLAAAGVEAVNVYRQPQVAVLPSGDELRRPGEPLGPGQIYDSNGLYLQLALREEGLDPTVWPAVGDEPGRLAAALRQLSEVFDVILCTGGVSAGERDLLPDLVADLGERLMWKVSMRPGMPFLFGRIGQAYVCGLPGNPVSVLATFRQLALPFIDALRGAEVAPAAFGARLQAPLRKSHARREFVRGLAWIDAAGSCHVQAVAANGSHRLRAAADSNVLIDVPEGEVDWPAGTVVPIRPRGKWL